MDGARAVLLDIDGVLTVFWEPLPGAVDAVRALRTADDLELDAGALLLGREQAADVAATVVGRYQASEEDAARGQKPRPVLDSIADLPALLGI